MSFSAGKWDDLWPRLISALVMVGVGLAAMAAGGGVYAGLAALIGGAMMWEMTRIVTKDLRYFVLAGAVAVTIFATLFLDFAVVCWVASCLALICFVVAPVQRVLFAVVGGALLLAGAGLIDLRETYGFVGLLWLVSIVVLSDIAAYFVGKAVAGPKLWPALSPKKTWSGACAGLMAACLVGLFYVPLAGGAIIPISVVLGLFAQLGDISESGVKRFLGTKDSSSLIPGHGGVFDRFDGMLGAALVYYLVQPLNWTHWES